MSVRPPLCTGLTIWEPGAKNPRRRPKIGARKPGNKIAYPLDISNYEFIIKPEFQRILNPSKGDNFHGRREDQNF
jgi:hypothetical protein